MNNKRNNIVSLSNYVKCLGEQADEAGVEVFPGFAASEEKKKKKRRPHNLSWGAREKEKKEICTENSHARLCSIISVMMITVNCSSLTLNILLLLSTTHRDHV